MALKLKLVGYNAVSFSLMAISSIFLFVSFESPFWAIVDDQDDNEKTTASIGVWQFSTGIDLPFDTRTQYISGEYVYFL